MTVGSTQRFYVIAKVGEGRAGARGAGACACGGACALLWHCAWQVGAALLARVGAQPPHYLPPDNTTTDYGKFQVSCGTSSRTSWGASVRVRVRSGARARDVWHVHYAKWPNNKTVPDDVDDFLAFLSEMNSLRVAGEAEAVGALGAGPLLLSCGAGAGRAGAALAADVLRDCLDNNQELDIPRTISTLHQQRANLIQNVHQYKFLHQLLLQYLKQSRLI